MKVLITGGTGFIGGYLIRSLTQDQHEVAVLTRSKKDSKNRYLNYLQWDGEQMPLGIGLYDVVINLAGASIAGGRWTEAYKKEIKDSRLKATRACVDYINRSPRRPEVFVSASAVGYYGVKQEGVLDENASAGDDFAAEVGELWEAEAAKAKCRTVIPRIGLVLGEDGGMMEKLLPIYQFYLGGKFASGKQGFPWVHVDDIVGGIRFLIDHPEAEGPFNFAAPELVTQSEFSKALANAMNVADIWTIPKFALNLWFGEQSFLFWGGQRISSEKLRTTGYQFRFEKLGPALQSIVD